jgi:hypothetical protein
MTKPKKPVLHKEKPRKFFVKEDFSKENLIQGGLIRPGILVLSFLSFMAGIILFIDALQGSLNAMKWAGSLMIFSFILTAYSIYTSLQDEHSVFRNLNVGFKVTLFVFEISIFHQIMLLIL